MIVQVESELYIERKFTDISNKKICDVLGIGTGNLTFCYQHRDHILTEFVKELSSWFTAMTAAAMENARQCLNNE